MNEGLSVFRKLTAEQREARLLRCGLHAAMTPAGRAILGEPEVSRSGVKAEYTYSSEQKRTTHRQRYRISVFNLEVIQLQALGTGQAMGKERNFVGQQTAADQPVLSPIVTDGDGLWNAAGGFGAGEVGQRGNSPASRRGTAGLLRGTAIRALYGLGLDSGEVHLAAMGERHYVVEDVLPLHHTPGQPLPGLYQAASQALALALAQEQPGRPGLLMGMDPEFLLLRESSGRVVPASRFLPLDGVAGCDAGPPGTQGVFPVAELRPAPRGEPRALLAQLMSAARTADRLVADRSLRWRAGGMPLPGWALGGHLHFSGVTLTAPLLRALDNYLALPLMLLEDARAAARRPRYGVLGDFRIQPHGGFEYRTLPSFLVSPVIAKGAVFLAHLIVSRYEDLTLRPLDREDLHAAYFSGNKTPLRPAFIPLQAQLRSLRGYAQAAPYIEPLLHYIAAERTWDEARDIRGLWRNKET